MNNNSLETLAHENRNSAYTLSLHVSELKAIRGAVEKLTEHVDNIIENKWYENSQTAYLSISEVQDTVHLINMAFRPLFDDMAEGVNDLNINSQELHDTVIKSKLKSKF